MGYAAEVSHCVHLCGLTYRAGDRGATNDMLVQSLRLQCDAATVRAAKREDIVVENDEHDRVTIEGTTQLIRAAMNGELRSVRNLVQLGAALDLVDRTDGWSALHWAISYGNEDVVRSLIDGKYAGRGASVNLRSLAGVTPLMLASQRNLRATVRLLLARGAKQELQDKRGRTALHFAVDNVSVGAVSLLCAAPGAAAAFALTDEDDKTPLARAIDNTRIYVSHHTALEEILRAHGAEL